MADAKTRPDWKAIEDRMRFYAFNDGTPPDRAGAEARAAVREMRDEYLRTGKLPKDWEGCKK
jgi:hypothetical protein